MEDVVPLFLGDRDNRGDREAPPGGELSYPIVDDGGRHDDQARAREPQRGLGGGLAEVISTAEGEGRVCGVNCWRRGGRGRGGRRGGRGGSGGSGSGSGGGAGGYPLGSGGPAAAVDCAAGACAETVAHTVFGSHAGLAEKDGKQADHLDGFAWKWGEGEVSK